MDRLPDLWRAHQQTSFPASALGVSIDGLPLVKLDARLGALLTAALRSDGVPRELPAAARDDLRDLAALAARALAELALDVAARAYFERLVRLAASI